MAQALVLAVMAPEIVPVAIIGGLAVGSYYLTEAILNRTEQQRYVGTRKTIDFSNTSGFKTPDPYDTDPLIPKSKIGKIIVGSLAGAELIDKIKQPIKELYSSLFSRSEQAIQRNKSTQSNNLSPKTISNSSGPVFNASEVARFVQNYKKITSQ